VRSEWLSLVASVEWRSEYRGKERPVAITLGGLRVAVEVERTWIEGSTSAGQVSWRVFLVRDSEGRSFRIRASEQTVLVEASQAP